MSSILIALSVVAFTGLVHLGVLFVGGRLVRRSKNDSHTPNSGNADSRFFQDLEPLEDLLVQFVAHTPEFARVLKLLASHDKALPLAQIVHELRISRNRSTGADIVAPLTGVALLVLRLIGLVRLHRGGFTTTVVGREVQRRMFTRNPGRSATVRSGHTGAKPPYLRLSVGKLPAENHGISWSASLRGTRPRRQLRLTNIGTLREPSRAVSASPGQRTTMNGENNIVVSAPDHAELSSFITESGKLSERAKWELRRLKNRLQRAQIMPPEEVPSDVVTLNSRAELLDVESGERMEFTPVWSVNADINDGKISVSTPLGTGMLGKRVGATFEWPVPYGIRRLKVVKVSVQAEANLQEAA